MNTGGKISSKQLREFQVNFLSCADYVKDTTPQEVRRVLMQKLPSWMKTWVAEAEQKKERNRPIVQIAAVEGMTEESMKRSIKKLIGEPPIKTQCMGGNVYRVTFNDYELAKKLLAFHSRKIAEGGRPLQICLVEQSFNAIEIFEMLHDKLTSRERVDSYHIGGEKEKERPERGNAREVSVEPPTATRDPPRSRGRGGNTRERERSPSTVPPPAPPGTFLAGFDPPVPSGGKGGVIQPQLQRSIPPRRREGELEQHL
jgi:DNA-binding phage protein